ncbi:hypothetical protein [Vallitalea guaymasensis]|nr:hypothetical protein [Vallitalea guaymasensis]
MKKTYQSPIVETYTQEELAHLIESGACSGGYTCHWHSGSSNTR